MTNVSVPTFSFTTTIRPGLLVAIKTSIKGNVSYKKTAAQVHQLDDGGEVAEWDTERRIKDAAEQEAATKARGRARSLISSLCSVTDFAYLCPAMLKPELEKAIAEARKVCDEFNRTSKVTKLRFNVVTGSIAQDDYQAVRAIRREIAELMTDMREGLENLDVKTVREAAGRLKQMGQMLSPEAEVRVELTVKQVRESIRKTAKAIEEAGETGAAEIDRVTIARLTEARTAFLDLDGADEIEQPAAEGRAVDLETEEQQLVRGQLANENFM